MQIKTILIIDDDRDFNDFIKISLEKRLQVLTALNGKDGISIAKSQKPNLILLDLAMPQLDGLAVYQTLKSDSTSSSIPIIFLTAMLGMERILKSKTNQNVEIITKHYNTTKLETQIYSAFNRSLAKI